MSETSSPPDTTQFDILLDVILALLAPIFLSATDGDITAARLAASRTIDAYRARTHADLIAVAQVVGFGLGAIGSLSLAVADDIPISLALRLRGNANACNRAAEQNRRALGLYRPAAAAPQSADPDQSAREAIIAAEVAATRQRAAQARAAQTRAETRAETTRTEMPRAEMAQPGTNQPGTIHPAARTAPGPATTDRQWQGIWATAMADVAAEYTADFASLPPAQRRSASLRAAALNSTANTLLTALAAGNTANP